MLRKLVPDFFFPDYRAVTPEFLVGQGISALLIDIDNTLAPYEVPEAEEAHRAWFAALAAAGIRVALLSNNNEARVELFNSDLGLPAYPRARKPLVGTPRRALAALGVPASSAAVLGDQIFTDVATGRRLGTRTILVPPIKDKRDPFTRFKRLLERPLMRAYRRRDRKNKESNREQE